MVGNSYTFFNDMPQLLTRMLNEDSADTYFVDAIARGGEKMAGHLDHGEVTAALKSKKYEVVFLQEQSLIPFYTNERPASQAAFATLITLIRAHGARPVVVETWPRKEGDAFYASPAYSNLINPKTVQGMSAMLHTYYKTIAQKNKATCLPVGMYWTTLQERNPEINLYAEDGTHPNAQGSYLFAALAYREVTGILPDPAHAAMWGLEPAFLASANSQLAQK